MRRGRRAGTTLKTVGGRWFVAAVLAVWSTVSSGQPHIARGLAYTVQVETRVTMPFLGDERGNFTGAGFLISRDPPRVLTNAHVASRSVAEIRVAFRDGDFQPATREYVDPHLDVAVLRINPDQIPAAVELPKLACDGSTTAGTDVAALGHPWGLPFTATRGIVSGNTTLEGVDWLQTDAALNHGNSGGPLVRLADGAVVGVSAARVEENNVQNLNFAVPARFVCTVLSVLNSGHDPTPPRLPAILAAQDPNGGTLTVAAPTASDSPLQGGDEVLAVGTLVTGQVRSQTELLDHLRGQTGTIDLFVRRDGEPRPVPVQLQPRRPVLQREGLVVAGALLVTSALEGHERFRGLRGAVVHSIEPGSIAGSLGLEPWSVVSAVDDRPVGEDLGALKRQLRDGAGEATLTVMTLSTRTDTWFDFRRVKLPRGDVDLITLKEGKRPAVAPSL